jgi:hypothetical protein
MGHGAHPAPGVPLLRELSHWAHNAFHPTNVVSPAGERGFSDPVMLAVGIALSVNHGAGQRSRVSEEIHENLRVTNDISPPTVSSNASLNHPVNHCHIAAG